MTPDELNRVNRLMPKLKAHLLNLERIKPIFDRHPKIGDLLACLRRELDVTVVAAMPEKRKWLDDFDATIDANPAASLVFLERLQDVYDSEFAILRTAAESIVAEDGLESVVLELRRL